MLRGFFVTGTDTGVGKTVTSAALMCRYRQAAPLRYWKPVQTGIEQDDDTAEVQRLARCGNREILAEGVRLPRPVSPHLAARWADAAIRIEDLTRLIHAQSDSEPWIVEGAGGVLVPLNESDLMIDLMRALALPVVVASRSSLGTINHTLLTVEALRARSLCVAGVVMIGENNPDNRAAIEQYGRVPVLGEMPFWKPLEPACLAAWAAEKLDTENRLLGLLQ